MPSIYTKNKILNSILYALYQQPRKYYKLILTKLIVKNNKAHGYDKLYGEVIYKGNVYKNYLDTSHYYYVKTFPIHSTLETEFKETIEKIDELKDEQYYVERFLTILLNFTTKSGNYLCSKTLREILGSGLYDILNIGSTETSDI